MTDTKSMWSWTGPIGRGRFTTTWIVVLALKYNLDRLLALAYDVYWSPFDYHEPLQAGFERIPDGLFGWVVVTAIPAIYLIVVATKRRLADIGAPTGLTVLALVPGLNLLFFVVLSVLPSERQAAGDLAWMDNVVPRSGIGAAAMGIFASVVPALLGAMMSVWGLEEYGLGVFMAIPFFSGIVAAMVFTYHEQRSIGQCFVVSLGSIALLAGLIFVTAVEGLICLIMAAPLAVVVAAVGGVVGYFLQGVLRRGRNSVHAMLALLMAVPLFMGAEHLEDDKPPLIPVETSVVVDAPPEVVWKEVVTFEDLPQPTDPLFETGIAYPTDATIDGEGVGAVRYCNFTTGPFVEPITVWDEPRKLAFDVSEHPPAMRETSIYEHLDAPHVDGYFVSERGQFLLEELPGGRTRLTGTTWYRHEVWPVAYWKVFSDEIIHRIHLRVLNHIARQTTL
jgi:hypothetical protein